MFLYADPEACPACRSAITPGTVRCDQCTTTLSGTVAQQLFATLSRADVLVRQLADLSANATAARTAAVQQPSFLPLGPEQEPFPAPAPAPRQRQRRGLSAASVPQILLGLGATCLLVAALVFLAVAWSALGVGGRTAVLVGLTAAAAGGGWLLARAGLRAGAESFMVLALGLLTLDLAGARTSGWLGDIADDGFACVLGTALAVAGLGATHLLRHTRAGRLVGAQLIGGLGWIIGTGGLASVVVGGSGRGIDLVAGSAVLWFAALAAGAWFARRIAQPAALTVVLLGLGLVWTELLLLGLVRIDLPPTVSGVWGGFEVWPALLAAGLAAGVALPVPAFGRVPELARVLGVAVAVTVVTALVTAPAIDEGGTTVALVGLAVALGAAGAVVLLPQTWRPVVAVPAAAASLSLLVSSAALVGPALESVWSQNAWSLSAMSTLERPDLAWYQPLLLPIAVFGVLVAVWVCLNQVVDIRIGRAAGPIGVAVAASATLVPCLYGVPLAVAVGVLLVAGCALVLAGVRAHGETALAAQVLGACATVLGLLASFQSESLTAVTTGLLSACAAGTTLARHPVLRTAGDIVFAPAAAVFGWTTLGLLGVDPTWRAVPILLVAGAWALLGARLERELPVAVTSVVTIALCVGEGAGNAQTWLAVDLTVAGVVAHLSALLHTHRRWMGWVGLALMVCAQWIRLDQLGVETVEAYTLPLAVVLLVVGALRIRISGLGSPRALGPGLTLALVPSLLVALTDPVSLRAALLGAACLVVLASGMALKWSAPLVAGATVGLVLVLREATYASVLPQWAMIGTIGVVLTVVGVTWEKRLSEVRTAVGYLRRLD